MSSLGVKTFLGLGAIAVIPLSSSFVFKNVEIDSTLGGAH